MAYVVPTTRAAGYVVTAASDWNILVADIVALRPDTCGVGRTAVQAIPDTTETAILWDAEAAENWDYTAMHSLVGDTERINILRTGIYLITANLRFAANATGIRQCQVYRSNVAVLWSLQQAGSATYDAYFSPSFVCSLDAGDYVSIKVVQTSTGSLNIQRDGVRVPNFAVTMLYDET